MIIANMPDELSDLFQSLSEEERVQAVGALVEEFNRRKEERKIDFYRPNPFQREFHAAGLQYRYRFLSGGTQSGKSWCAGYETAFHMRGEYPEWWTGRRLDPATPNRGLVVGIDQEQLRGAAQMILLGEENEGGGNKLGTGCIPKDWLAGEPKYKRDGNNCVDFFQVRHVSGGVSTAYFVTQNMRDTKFQGQKFFWIWPDESITEMTMMNQFLSRITSTDGMIYLTACPEKMGYTEVYKYFDPGNPERPPQAWYREASLREVTHLSRERIHEIIMSYPEHVRPYKVDGKPVFGVGMVYPISEQLLKCEPFRIPKHWKRIAGIDFGFAQSLTAVVWIAIDPNTGIHYVYDRFAVRGKLPHEVVPHIKQRDKEAGFDIPVSFPRDGNHQERGTGNVIADNYRDLDVNMLDEAAIQIGIDGKKSATIEPGIQKILELMQIGKFKIMYSSFVDNRGVLLPDPKMEILFQEMRAYMRDENGEIKKTIRNDPHHWDAIRYGEMMIENAQAFVDMRTTVKVAPVASSYSRN